MKERRPACLTITSLHQLKTCIELPTPSDKLSLELVTSPLKKKSITTFRSQVVDLEEDEERTCSNEIGDGGGKELHATTTHSNLEEEPKPNLDQVIDNIQLEHVESVEPIVLIIKPTQHIIVAIELFELVQIENP